MQDWQQQLANAVTCLDQLLTLLQLDPQMVAADERSAFPLRVPHAFIQRMRVQDPLDPLLLQVLPSRQEQLSVVGYTNDPLQEYSANPIPGLLHKYHGRVLLIVTGGCAVNCRYCFRRHFPYVANAFSMQQMQAIIEYIQKDNSIVEVILSGGDPLLLKDMALASMVRQLETITHLRYLRIHTRLPIVIPARITAALVAVLQNTRLRVSVVVHCNHYQEINADVAYAMAQLRAAEIQLFNQAVLLKKVNDDAAILIKLSHQLYEMGVLPYYLHMLDPVAGTAHFAVSEQQGLQIIQQMRQQLPGFLVPRFVKEIALAPSKVPIYG